MKPRSAKAKGRTFSAEVAATICRRLGISPDEVQVTPSGVNGPDIYFSPAALKLFPFTVECKNQQTIKIWSALAQAAGHAIGTALVPLLIFRRNRSESFVTIHIDDFLELVLRGNANAVTHRGDATNAEESRVLF